MIDIEKLRKGLEICSANDECYNCPYYPKAECFCQIGLDSLELLNDYERLAALHVDLLDKVEALLKTLKEAREEYKVTAKLPDGETVETNGTLEECILWADIYAANHPGVTINIDQVVGE